MMHRNGRRQTRGVFEGRRSVENEDRKTDDEICLLLNEFRESGWKNMDLNGWKWSDVMK